MKQLIVLMIVAVIATGGSIEKTEKKGLETNINTSINKGKETIAKEKEETKIGKIKFFLQENKIFFEIFSSVLLGIMSIVISVVGTNINNKTKKIYEKQLEILQNDRYPYFILKSKLTLNGAINQIEEYKYTLKNIGGGRISCFYIDIETFLEIIVYCDKIYQKFSFKVLLPKYLYKNYAHYDNKKQKFIFEQSPDIDIDEIKNKIKNKIKNGINISIYKCNVNVIHRKCIKIKYANYQNNLFSEEYLFDKDEISLYLINNEFINVGTIQTISDTEIIISNIETEIISKISHSN